MLPELNTIRATFTTRYRVGLAYPTRFPRSEQAAVIIWLTILPYTPDSSGLP